MSKAEYQQNLPGTPQNDHEAPDRDIPGQSGLPGQPLTTLLFYCEHHGEEQAIDYYDPESPPRCSHGDLMARKVP